MSFQNNLREYREKARYKKAKDFSDALGIPYSTYLSYENAGKEPKYNTLVKIADTLSITTDELLGHIPPTVWNGLLELKPVDGGYMINDWVGLETDKEKFIPKEILQEIMQAGEKLRKQYISDCLRWYIHEHDEQQE